MGRSWFAAACVLLTLGTAPRAERRRRHRVEYRRPHLDSRHEHAAAGGVARAGDSSRGDLRRRQRDRPDARTVSRPEPVPASASEEAAASAAAHRVLVTLFPAQRHFHRAASTIVRHSDGPQKQAGLAWGGLVADRSWPRARTTVRTQSFRRPSGRAPASGSRRRRRLLRTAAAVGIRHAVRDADRRALRPPGPPTLDSAQWAADYNEVKALGAAVGSTRTADQTQIALFWADGAGTDTPPGHWNQIAQQVAAAQRNSLEENARLFALLNVALADAAICAWDAKYAYNFWRPVTAIRAGDTDGNDETAADPTWSRSSPRRRFPTTPPATARSAARPRRSWRGSMAATTSRSSPVPMRCPASLDLRQLLRGRGRSRRQPHLRRHSLHGRRIRMDWPRARPLANRTFANILQPKGNEQALVNRR